MKTQQEKDYISACGDIAQNMINSFAACEINPIRALTAMAIGIAFILDTQIEEEDKADLKAIVYKVIEAGITKGGVQ